MPKIFIIFINVSKMQACMNVAAATTAADCVSVVCIIIMVLRPMIISSDKVTHNKDELNFSVHRVDVWAISKKCFHSLVSALLLLFKYLTNHQNLCAVIIPAKTPVWIADFFYSISFFFCSQQWSWMIFLAQIPVSNTDFH